MVHLQGAAIIQSVGIRREIIRERPRQQVAFREKCRKIKGCGSWREDFYTRFKSKIKDLGLWHGGKCERNGCLRMYVLKVLTSTIYGAIVSASKQYIGCLRVIR